MSLEGLEALRVRFRERALDDLRSVTAWIAADCPPSESIERLIHNLAGAAGTFGFAELHQAAARVDDAMCAGVAIQERDRIALIEALNALRASHQID